MAEGGEVLAQLKAPFSASVVRFTKQLFTALCPYYLLHSTALTESSPHRSPKFLSLSPICLETDTHTRGVCSHVSMFVYENTCTHMAHVHSLYVYLLLSVPTKYAYLCTYGSCELVSVGTSTSLCAQRENNSETMEETQPLPKEITNVSMQHVYSALQTEQFLTTNPRPLSHVS